MSRKDDSGEQRLDELFARLRSHIAPPGEEVLRAASRSASAEERQPTRTRRPLRMRWPAVAVAAALLIGGGLGFGFGSWFTPSGSARTEFAGLGFLPANGWTVVQSGSLDQSGEARALAANVRLDPGDDLGGLPLATLDSLPARGVVIFASFTPRGEPGHDFAFPLRDLPLRIDDADPTAPGDPLPVRRGLAHHKVRASVGGTNVEVDVYVGTDPAPTSLLATAQRQLNRLVVASDRVTIFARRPATRLTGWTLFGSVDSRRAGEAVTIQARDCGLPSFRAVAGASTVEGGGWSTTFYPRISTRLRAIWKDATSAPIEIRLPVSVWLRKRSGGQLEVSAGGAKSFWGKRVRIERLDGRLGRWRFVRTIRLTEDYPSMNSPPVGTSASFARFKPRLATGTLLRAVMPLSEARPCYTAGASPTVRL
jgi:hypothetical protein